jgi:hypothetical protein
MQRIESSQLTASTSWTATQQSRFRCHQILVILLGSLLGTFLSLCVPASVRVTPPVVSIVTSDPSSAGAEKLSATVYNWAGHILRWPKFVWSSDGPSVATVDHNGIVKIVGPGMVDITARTFGGHGANAVIEVLCPFNCDRTPTSVQYQQGRGVTWTAETIE